MAPFRFGHESGKSLEVHLISSAGLGFVGILSIIDQIQNRHYFFLYFDLKQQNKLTIVDNHHKSYALSFAHKT